MMNTVNLCPFLLLLLFVGLSDAQPDKYKCGQSDLDKLDTVSARIMSLSVHQRKFPDARPAVADFCK